MLPRASSTQRAQEVATVQTQEVATVQTTTKEATWKQSNIATQRPHSEASGQANTVHAGIREPMLFV